jgi:hypothetical protein
MIWCIAAFNISPHRNQNRSHVEFTQRSYGSCKKKGPKFPWGPKLETFTVVVASFWSMLGQKQWWKCCRGLLCLSLLCQSIVCFANLPSRDQVVQYLGTFQEQYLISTRLENLHFLSFVLVWEIFFFPRSFEQRRSVPPARPCLFNRGQFSVRVQRKRRRNVHGRRGSHLFEWQRRDKGHWITFPGYGKEIMNLKKKNAGAFFLDFSIGVGQLRLWVLAWGPFLDDKTFNIFQL